MDALCRALSSIAALVKGPVLNAWERIAAATVKWQTKRRPPCAAPPPRRCARTARASGEGGGRAAAPQKPASPVAIDVSALVLCRLARACTPSRLQARCSRRQPLIARCSQRATMSAPPPTPTTRTALRREICLLALTLEYCGGARYCAGGATASSPSCARC